ncbi:hypothetical protein GQ44DRAFT_725319 [Phaeosphaeriaceae sp. PMI808]|nr:hypothetical protein GQ44DRAFT_734515 [Phaeosphaeriaceae sp. PMI808]KAH8727439.1 hypothetical protein GQ44DRAFT_725319 [Phaeosphaeriaceae sp. PMI808]
MPINAQEDRNVWRRTARKFGKRLSLIPSLVRNSQELLLKFQPVDENINILDQELHNHNDRIQLLETEVPQLFSVNFDPLKARIEQQPEGFSQIVKRIDDEAVKLKLQPSQAPTQSTPQLALDVQGIKNLKYQVVQLYERLNSDTNSIMKMREEMATQDKRLKACENDTYEVKATVDGAATEQRFDQFNTLLHFSLSTTTVVASGLLLLLTLSSVASPSLPLLPLSSTLHFLMLPILATEV